METEERIKALEEQVKDLERGLKHLLIAHRGFTDSIVTAEERNEIEYSKLRVERQAMSLVNQRMIERKYSEYAGEIERIKDHMRIMEQDNPFLKGNYGN